MFVLSFCRCAKYDLKDNMVPYEEDNRENLEKKSSKPEDRREQIIELRFTNNVSKPLMMSLKYRGVFIQK
jgi:hypothetical protein